MSDEAAKEKRLERLIEQFGEAEVARHTAAVKAATEKYGKVVEVLTAQGSVICRPPVEDLEAAYCRYLDGLCDVGLNRESVSTVNRRLVEACVLIPSPDDRKVQKQQLTTIFRKAPALVGELTQALATLAGGPSVSIEGN